MVTQSRELVLTVLNRIEQEGSYSNLLLNNILKRDDLPPQDRSLMTELVYGTISHKLKLDYVLSQYLSSSIEKLQPWVLNLFRLSFYQLIFLDRIPPYAVVNESVQLAKKKGHQGISRLVNGVLRSYLRNPEKRKLPQHIKGAQRISLEYSHPQWLVERWIQQFGEHETEAICRANNQYGTYSIRVNPLKTSSEQVINLLNQEATPSQLSPQGIRIHGGGNLVSHPGYKQGLFTIQDESSMLVAPLLDVKPGLRVLDVCAAPGGKTTHIAELMQNTGEVIANDLHPHKERLIKEQAQRLGLTNIKTHTANGATLTIEQMGTFDRILLDAPCTGFGVIRSKPDLKWNKSREDIENVQKVQYHLLEKVTSLLKPGGKLVYSTCTIEKDENENLIRRFLKERPQFQLDDTFIEDLPYKEIKEKIERPGMLQILPHYWGTDGFFIARITHRP